MQIFYLIEIYYNSDLLLEYIILENKNKLHINVISTWASVLIKKIKKVRGFWLKTNLLAENRKAFPKFSKRGEKKRRFVKFAIPHIFDPTNNLYTHQT